MSTKPKVLRATCDHAGPNKLRVHMSDKDYDELQDKLNEREARCKALDVAVKNEERRAKNHEAVIAKMQAQMDSDYQQLISKDAHAAALSHRNLELDKQCAQYKAALSKWIEECSSLRAKLDTYEARNAELENILKNRPAEMAAEYESLKHVLHKRGETITELEERLRKTNADAVARANRYNEFRKHNKAAEVWARRADAANARAAVARERLDLLLSMLAGLFGWEDKSYLHAVMHVENAVNNMKAAAGVRRWEENKEKKNE